MTARRWPTICASMSQSRQAHAKAQTWHKARHTMAKNTKNTQAHENTADKAQAAQIAAVERALFTLVKAGRHDLVDLAILKSGLAISAEEHAAARPMTAEEIAAAALADIGLDIASLDAGKAQAGVLAVNLDALAKAVGKYGRHAVICDVDNGTSLATHYMLNALAKAGRVTLADTLAYVRQHKASYASAGHYNTIKSLLKKAGYRLNVAQGSFSITA